MTLNEQIAEAEATLDALKALRALEARIRGPQLGEYVPTQVPCGFCARPVLLTAYACDCGWKVAV